VKQEDKTTIISYRIEQAQIALDDSIYLNAGGEARKAFKPFSEKCREFDYQEDRESSTTPLFFR